MNATANESRRNAAANDAGPANDLALLVTSAIDVTREDIDGRDEWDETVELTGVVTFDCDGAATIAVDQREELSPQELRCAEDKLLDAALAMTEAACPT